MISKRPNDFTAKFATKFESTSKMFLIKIFISLAVFICLNSSLNAQSDSLKTAIGQLAGKPAGNVDVVADSMVMKLEKSTRKYREIKGYRIQIFLGSYEQASTERNKYLSLGLPYSAYIKQVVPEQALQVGDFLNRMEMEKHLELIRKHYPKAFGVVEVIEPPRFSGKK
jgi:hypothetical protein